MVDTDARVAVVRLGPSEYGSVAVSRRRNATAGRRDVSGRLSHVWNRGVCRSGSGTVGEIHRRDARHVRRHSSSWSGRPGRLRRQPGWASAMRRLSIIDLATGRQPIHNENKTIWIVFNGEIYNYRELRDALSDRGPPVLHVQRHRSDRSRVRGVGRERVRPAAWHVRARAVGRADADADSRPRSRGHQAAPLRRARRTALFASEIKSLLAAGVVDTDDRSCGARSLSFVLIRRRTGPSSPASASFRQAICCVGTTGARRCRSGVCRPRNHSRAAKKKLRVACVRCWPMRSAHTSSATCRSAHSSPAASTRVSSSA